MSRAATYQARCAALCAARRSAYALSAADDARRYRARHDARRRFSTRFAAVIFLAPMSLERCHAAVDARDGARFSPDIALPFECVAVAAATLIRRAAAMFALSRCRMPPHALRCRFKMLRRSMLPDDTQRRTTAPVPRGVTLYARGRAGVALPRMQRRRRFMRRYAAARAGTAHMPATCYMRAMPALIPRVFARSCA